MRNKNKIKWNLKDYVRTVGLHVGQVIFTSFLFILALIINTNGLKGLNEFLSVKSNDMECIYTIIAITLVMCVTYMYLFYEERDFLYQTSKNLMLFAIITVSLISCFFIGKVNLYLRPFSICALLTLLLIGKRPALFINCIFSFLMFLCDLFLAAQHNDIRHLYGALVINFISGIFAVFLVDGEGSRLKVLSSSIFISIPVVISSLCLEYDSTLPELGLIAIFSLVSGFV
jgi:membrane-associated HD superfamily phosphohydrolase